MFVLRNIYIFLIYIMTSLADRDKLISHLQDQIDGYNAFLGGGTRLTEEEKDKLRVLESYLKEHGEKKDLETIASLISLH